MTEPSVSRPERLTPEQRTLLQKKQGIELSRKRVLHDLETSTSSLYRRNLQAGLDYLNEQIAAVDDALLHLNDEERANPSKKGSAGRIPIRPRTSAR
ncbi:MAG TPA: hypothetical protein VFV54_10945 [Thermoanaerobaculia bacterium]|nr:hypothetical protein [Thermoanaerobaculia bacterium]